jgi:predicted dinucleotide-binding enzyme
MREAAELWFELKRLVSEIIGTGQLGKSPAALALSSVAHLIFGQSRTRQAGIDLTAESNPFQRRGANSEASRPATAEFSTPDGSAA